MKPQILVVDDELVARQSLSEMLKLEGYLVNHFPNGQMAIEFARTNTVDLMIVDLKMPGMDGLEVIQVLNQISPDTEVILLTAFGSIDSAVQSLRLRIHDYLLKPASHNQIMSSVKKALTHKAAKAQARNPEFDDADDMVMVTLKDGTTVDLALRQIKHKNKIEHLTPAEGRLLRILIKNEGKVFSHRELVLLVQGYDTTQREAPEILRPLVSRLRHKLERFPVLAEKVVSVRGTGYIYKGGD
jgi:DNA-binding response OmpR family regulator